MKETSHRIPLNDLKASFHFAKSPRGHLMEEFCSAWKEKFRDNRVFGGRNQRRGKFTERFIASAYWKEKSDWICTPRTMTNCRANWFISDRNLFDTDNAIKSSLHPKQQQLNPVQAFMMNRDNGFSRTSSMMLSGAQKLGWETSWLAGDKTGHSSTSIQRRRRVARVKRMVRINISELGPHSPATPFCPSFALELCAKEDLLDCSVFYSVPGEHEEWVHFNLLHYFPAAVMLLLLPPNLHWEYLSQYLLLPRTCSMGELQFHHVVARAREVFGTRDGDRGRQRERDSGRKKVKLSSTCPASVFSCSPVNVAVIYPNPPTILREDKQRESLCCHDRSVTSKQIGYVCKRWNK